MSGERPPSPRPAPGASNILYLFVFLLLSLLLTWPVATRPFDYVISEFMDVSTAFYNFLWFHHSIFVFHTSPWTNPLLDYPFGYSMAFYPMWIPYDILGLPFIMALDAQGMPLAFNFATLISTLACGFCAFLLVRHLTRDPAAALVAGAALAFCPFRLWNLTRIHVSCLELLAISFYFFLRLARESGRGPLVGFIISASLLVYTSPPYTADMAMALAIALVFLAVIEKDKVLTRATAKRVITAGAAIVVVCSPFLVRAGIEVFTMEGAVQPEEVRAPFSANLAGFVLPGSNLRSFSFLCPGGGPHSAWVSREHGIFGYEVFLGYSVLTLALLGVVFRRRQARLWLILAALFMLMSLGPVLHAGPVSFDLSMPYEWMASVLPWLRLERSPVRHLGVAMVCLIALSGMGLAAARQRLQGFRRTGLTLVALAAVLLEFNQAPLDLSRIPVPAFVKELRDDPAPGAVLDLPLISEIRRLAGYYHMHHMRPLAYQPTAKGHDPSFSTTAIYRCLQHPGQWLDMTSGRKKECVNDLQVEYKRRKIRYVVVFPRFMDKKDLAAATDILPRLGPHKLIKDSELYKVYRYEQW